MLNGIKEAIVQTLDKSGLSYSIREEIEFGHSTFYITCEPWGAWIDIPTRYLKPLYRLNGVDCSIIIDDNDEWDMMFRSRKQIEHMM